MTDINHVESIQLSLVRLGFDCGAMDGIYGPKTRTAIEMYANKNDFQEIDTAIEMLFKQACIEIISNNEIWMHMAESLIGLKEIHGPHHNITILGFWDSIKLGGVNDDETPWCAAFVGGILEQNGITSTRSGLARSYNDYKWGQNMPGPCRGSIVTFWRKERDGPYGHVGFVVGKDKAGNLLVLGGNQGDEVNIKAFPHGRVLGYKWPSGFLIPPNGLDRLLVLDLGASLSTSEA